MMQHKPKLLTVRSKQQQKNTIKRPANLRLKDIDTASLDSGSCDCDVKSCDCDVTVSSKDTLLQKARLTNDYDSPRHCDVYEADSEVEDNEDYNDSIVIANDGYLFVDVDIEDGDIELHNHGNMCRSPEEALGKVTKDKRSNKAHHDNCLTLSNGCNDQLMLNIIAKSKLKPLAPPLHENLQFHAFFLFHRNDREWTMNIVDKLESPPLSFQCCCHERDYDFNGSLQSSTHIGIKNSKKTIMVLTPDFIADVWCHDDMQLLSEMDVLLIQKDLVLVVLQDCDIPGVLDDVVCVDVRQDDWWGRMLAHIISSEDTPLTEETALSLSSSLVGLNPNLQSGHLLHSAKSRCRCCGKEVVDPLELPDELIAHGIQIPPDEYREAISHLMCDNKFRCHVWCYNVPAAMVFFTFLLALCLTVIPLIEAKLVFHSAETGLEFVHAGVVWLCALTLYMIIMQISKRQMKGNTYKRLTFVNTILIKYNLLAGVENLGLADCNKYYLHFFYFEIGPCLAYLQELMVNIEEYSACFRNQMAESGDVAIEMDCDDTATIGNDQSRVLNNTNMTNRSMQTQAEDLILEHSGEYITMLITKRLDRPRRSRHVRDSLCLCQFVEQRVYKMIV